MRQVSTDQDAAEPFGDGLSLWEVVLRWVDITTMLIPLLGVATVSYTVDIICARLPLLPHKATLLRILFNYKKN